MERLGRGAMPSREQMAACMATLATVFADLREQALVELDLRPGKSLLDAGCGAGELAIAVAPRVQPGGRVVGVDLDAETISRAGAAAENAGVVVDFRVGDVRELPFGNGEFDAVRSERVFQHLERTDWPQAATELLRVTRPGGIIQLIDPDHLQSAIAATDTELTRLLVADLVTLPPNPESGIHLPRLLPLGRCDQYPRRGPADRRHEPRDLPRHAQPGCGPDLPRDAAPG